MFRSLNSDYSYFDSTEYFVTMETKLYIEVWNQLSDFCPIATTPPEVSPALAQRVLQGDTSAVAKSVTD